jgi:hypothetical protein
MGALDMNFFKFFVIDLEVLALSDPLDASRGRRLKVAKVAKIAMLRGSKQGV